MDTTQKQFNVIEIKDASGRSRTFVISTSAPDRDNDTVNANGWELDNYKKNPVVLFAHQYDGLPIARCTNIRVQNGQLVATAEFADHEMADTVLRLIDGGFLRATSVGFRGLESHRNDAGGIDYLRQELLEFSIVPVPANPEAVTVTRSALRKWLGDDDVVLELDDDPVAKRGRVLSSATEAKVRQAVSHTEQVTAHAAKCGEHLADVLRTLPDPEPEEDVTVSADDDEVEVSAADLTAAFSEVMPSLIRNSMATTIQREVARSLARTMGRIVDPVDDRARHHRRSPSHGGRDDVLDIDADDVTAIAEALRDVVAQSFSRGQLAHLVEREMNRQRGRLD